MGENNCVWTRRPMLHRNTIELAEKKYQGKTYDLWKNMKMSKLIGKKECQKSVIITSQG